MDIFKKNTNFKDQIYQGINVLKNKIMLCIKEMKEI